MKATIISYSVWIQCCTRMELTFEYFSSAYCLILVLLITCLYLYGTSTFNYWKDRGVVYVKPMPLIGNSINFIIRTQSQVQSIGNIYNNYKNERFVGTFAFRSPSLFLRDPVLINEVLTSDFTHFHDRGFATSEKLNPLNSNLLNLSGAQWKNLRKKLSPVFTSGKLKTMMDELDACAEDLVKYFDDNVSDCSEIELRQLMSQFTTKVIGSIAFGCKLDTLNDPNSEFLENGQKIFKITYRTMLSLFVFSVSPKLREFLGIKSMPQNVEDFYLNFVKKSVEYREKNNYQRNDFLQLLINLRKEDSSGASKFLQNSLTGSGEDRNNSEDKPMILDDTLMAANVFIFFVAGFETTASTLSNCLLELAVNPDIQQRLRDEISTAMKENEKLNYEVVKDMKYMEQVISETLRKYSVAISLNRVCTQKYKIPGTDVVIDEGVKVVVPVYSIHMDPQYYPEPEKFDPERFSEENKKNRQNGTYLPFGDGPRICIGLRFALLEMKVALAHVLSRYQFSMTDKMAYPLEFSKKSFLLAPKDGIWLKVSKLKQE